MVRDWVFESVFVIVGCIDGWFFVWIVDVDMCFGLLFEVIVNGCYYWIFFSCLWEVWIEKLCDLWDVVWMLV